MSMLLWLTLNSTQAGDERCYVPDPEPTANWSGSTKAELVLQGRAVTLEYVIHARVRVGEVDYAWDAATGWMPARESVNVSLDLTRVAGDGVHVPHVMVRIEGYTEDGEPLVSERLEAWLALDGALVLEPPGEYGLYAVDSAAVRAAEEAKAEGVVVLSVGEP